MRAFVFTAGLISVATAASASETITYTYDALGRLVQVARSGTVNNGASAGYTYDPANNRTNVTVTGGGGGMALTKLPTTKDQTSQKPGAASGSHRK